MKKLYLSALAALFAVSATAQKVTGQENGHDYVDLGVTVNGKKVYWATCNIGASSPEKFGDYFAWGEIEANSEVQDETKRTYTPANCSTHKVLLYENNTDASTAASEKNDPDLADKYVKGNSVYDAARAQWGGKWRMPTAAELDALLAQCDWFWKNNGINNTGVPGYQVKIEGQEGVGIFLPAAGYKTLDQVQAVGTVGEYWTCTPHEPNTGISDHKVAHFLVFYHNTYTLLTAGAVDSIPNTTNQTKTRAYRTYDYRSNGKMIRPVWTAE